ncbi:hypothetical protein DCAR_0310927 [Daucus carota subsp. sativus]|uniref:Uncharacterized protein n=1 Tax=Daucus carota subsp. sativus TaxID=79200 RepID=A0AAF0WLB8_DAUCS|nr:hypothetical protein DCAR_0310927 [Daucus carota subsp. sativus]
MVFNSPIIVTVAKVSANACQYIACNPQILNSDQVLHLIFCFPFQQFRRFTLCLCSVFCCPARNVFVSDSDSDSDSEPYDSHSD